ncbi:MAG: radical SAM protein [Candidatus Lokiarchaeota archaeon]|nr:radical SAM protein [Candidatus Lokiarchaeota archaeon]MBD3201944.1 radical SAM protein [Candidatus Lokiarchaeota archaeon]
MKWNKILLVNPNYKTTGYDFYDSAFPPLALQYLAAYVKDFVDVKILDTKALNFNLRDFYIRLKEQKPDMVGLTVPVTSAINHVLEYAKIAKKLGCTVVIGGWHPTLAVEQTLSSPWIDILVRGEGELTFQELIKKGTPENVAGLSYKINGKKIHNEDRPFIKDLNTLKFPARELVKDYEYKVANLTCDAIETSRGCPQGCKFCSTHVVYKKSWRPRSVENIMKELKLISKNKKIQDVFLVDDNILVNIKRMKRLCIEIIKAKSRGEIRKSLYFFFQARLDKMGRFPEVTKLMGKAGFWLVLVGVEATDNARLEKVNKNCKIDEIKKGIKALHDSGIVIMGNVIIGVNLDDNLDDILKTIMKTKRLTLDLPSFTLLTPFPATGFYEEVKGKNLLLTEDYSMFNWLNPVIKTDNFSPEALKKLLFFGFYYVSFYGGGLKNKLRLLKRVLRKRGITFIFSIGRFIKMVNAYFGWRRVVLKGLDGLTDYIYKEQRDKDLTKEYELKEAIIRLNQV